VKRWKKTGYFAGGVIYASGNLRKLVVNGNKVAAYKVSDMNIYEPEAGNSQRNRRRK
jgi:hypothetical protein